MGAKKKKLKLRLGMRSSFCKVGLTLLMTSKEGNLTERCPHRKTTSQEDNLKELQSQRKKALLEDDLERKKTSKGRRPQ